jgi:integrase
MKLDAKTVAGLTLPAGKTDAIHFDGALPGFGFRLRAGAGDVRKSWIAQYRRAGATRRMLLGSAEVLTADQARAAAKKVLAAVALGEDPQAEKTARRSADKFTFAALAEEFLAVKETTLKPRTLTETRRYLRGPYFKPLHSMPADTVSRKDIAARLLVITRERGTTTALRARSVVSELFSWAMGQGLCETNPVIGTNRPKKPPPRERVLSDAELAAVWRGAVDDDDFGRIVRLLMLLGQRRSEVGSMTWHEVDLERGTWTIPSSRTKNARPHTLPLPPLAIDIITGTPRMVGRDVLFGERAGRGFTSWARPKKMLDVRLGDEVEAWTLHDLRRSCATRMCDLGVAPHVVEQILNHQSGHRAGIARVYNRSSYEREVKAALLLWDDHIRSIITEGGERKVVPMPSRAS